MEMTGKIQEVDYKIAAGLVPGGSGEGIRRHGRQHTLFNICQAMPSYAKLGPSTLETPQLPRPGCDTNIITTSKTSVL